MGYIKPEQVEKLKDRLDIVEIISNYVELKISGSGYKGLCPFHHEKTPSFMVSRQKNNFHCFGCHTGGDAISFIMNIENLDYIGAIKFLADKLGIVLEETEYNKEKQSKNTRLYKINSLAAKFYFKNLLMDKFPQEYIAKRKLSSKILNEYFLGYAKNDNGLYNFLKKQNVSESDMLELGLIAKSNDSDSYYDKFRNRLIFPIIDNKNRVIGFGGRTLFDHKIKYLNSPESSIFIKGDNIYGINTVQKNKIKDKIILVEGYIDVISLFNYGINYAVASLGTALTENQANLIKRYGKNIFIAYDSDEAGKKATLRAIDIFLPLNVNLGILEFPNGMDPDEFVKEYGKEKFDSLIKKAKKPLDFKLDFIIKNNSTFLDGLKEIIEFLAKIESNVVRDVYIEKSSQYLNISSDSLRKDINSFIDKNKNFNFRIKGYKKSTNSQNIKNDSAGIKRDLEIQLIINSCVDEKSYEYLRNISKKFINSSDLVHIYEFIEEQYKSKGKDIFVNIFREDIFKMPGLTEEINKFNSIRSNNNSKIVEELYEKVSKFILEERQYQVRMELKKEISAEKRDELVLELMEIMQKLTQ